MTIVYTYMYNIVKMLLLLLLLLLLGSYNEMGKRQFI